MITELKPYPEYKDSGLPWLGQVPKHWDIQPAFSCYSEKQVRNTGMLERKVLSLSYGRIVVKPDDKLHGLVPESFKTYQIACVGDIVIRPTDLQNDHNSIRVGHVGERGIITSAYLCLNTKGKMSNGYGYKFLAVWDLTKAIYGYGSGLRQSLGFDHFKRMPVALPPPDEQDAIVSYLDDFDRKFKRFIRNRRQLIKVLNEQKQAIINRAVTRGLDPDAPMKDSGVEWIGEIPEHWEVRRLRNVAEMRVSNVDKHSKEGEKPVRLCNYTDVYKNPIITAEMPFMEATATAEEITSFRLRVGDVIITKDSEDWKDIGVPAFVAKTADDLICGYHLAILRPMESVVEGRFLVYALQSKSATTQFSVAANGVTRCGLSHVSIKAISIVVPPLDEQRRVCEHVETSTSALNAAIRRAHREIDLAREYRTRLIADVVTGKIDVRQGMATAAKTQSKTSANIHFRRAVFAAEIVHRLHNEPTFGHVKFEKLIFIAEKMCGVDTGSTYYRQAAGPYDNRALRSIDSQFKRQKWYECRKNDKGYRYVPLDKAGGHLEYFVRYFGDVMEQFNATINTFRSLKTDQCEIVATLYSAWEDLLAKGSVTDDQVIDEVLHHWHPAKQKTAEDRWRHALDWMKSKGFVPSAPPAENCDSEWLDGDLYFDQDVCEDELKQDKEDSNGDD